MKKIDEKRLQKLLCELEKIYKVLPVATEWSVFHTTGNGYKYKQNDLVWFEGYIYKALQDNSGSAITNTFFWEKICPGFRIRQEQADFEATEGASNIRNKPDSFGGGGVVVETDPIFQAWFATNPLDNYALLSSLVNKADLVLGVVPQIQSQGSTLSYDSVNGIITLIDARGDSHTIDLPIENLFQNASYNSGTQQLTLITNGGGTIVVDLATLVDLPEIVVSASSNPVTTPTTGQRMYLRADNGSYWISSGGIWSGPFLGVTTAEKAIWNSKYDGTNPLSFETPTQLNTRDTNNRARANHTGTQSISTVTGLQTELNNKQNINEYKTKVTIFEPFVSSSINASPYASSVSSGGTNSIASPLTDTTRQPALVLKTNANAAAIASVILGNANSPGSIKIGYGQIIEETRIYITPNLSDATDRYYCVFGLMSTANIISNSGCFFLYDEGNQWGFGALGGSPNWKCVNVNGVSRTSVDTGIPVAINTWNTLKVAVNTNATQVDYYINNVLVASITTDIYTTTDMHVRLAIAKRAGTNNRQLEAIYCRHEFTRLTPLP